MRIDEMNVEEGEEALRLERLRHGNWWRRKIWENIRGSKTTRHSQQPTMSENTSSILRMEKI